MKNVSILFILFNIFTFGSCVYPKTKKIFSAPAASFPDGKKSDIVQTDIGRAGVLLVVPLDTSSTNPFEKYGIIVGHDKNLDSWMVGQAGKCEAEHSDTAVTASHELEEETGGYYKLSPQKIAKLPYLSAGQKQMYIYKVQDPGLVSKIKSAVKQIQHDTTVGRSYKEIDDVEVVSLQEMFQLADKIDQCQVGKGEYFVTTASNKKIRLNRLYSQIFAHSCDHTRLEHSKKMFTMIVQ